MVKGNTPWDRLPVPRTMDEFKEAVQNINSTHDMFFATRGLPRAYMEIQSQNGPAERVQYVVLGYWARGERAWTESLLVERLWRDMVLIRRQFEALFGEAQPILFWRREPEIKQDGPPPADEVCYLHDARAGDCDCSNRPTRTRITVRIGVPGLDLTPIAARDGMELPELAQHAGSCSNQNVLDPVGKYRDAGSCGCMFGAGSIDEDAQTRTTTALRGLLDAAATSPSATTKLMIAAVMNSPLPEVNK